MPSKGWSRQQIHYLSRNPRFLLRLVVLIIGVSFITALAASSWHQWLRLRDAQRDNLVAQLERRLTGEDASPASIASALRDIRRLVEEGFLDPGTAQAGASAGSLSLTALEDLLARSPLDVSQRKLFVAYLNASLAGDDLRGEGRTYIETHARMKPPHRFANEFLGDLLANEGALDDAIACFEIEAGFPEAEYARDRLLALILDAKDSARLRELLAEDAYRKRAAPRQQIEIALLLEDWAGLAAAVVAYDYRAKDNPERILTLFAAAAWFIIVVQFGRYSRGRLVFLVLGVIAGIASGTATLYVVIVQENAGGMTSGDDWIEEIIYFVVGVALREEVIKLAFFALLAPFLLRRRNSLDAFLTAACVGLGFALQENISYYQGNEAVALKRFLTANFFHLAATGLLGLALYEFLRAPKRRWEELLATFIGVVLAHGAYNSLLSVAELAEYSILYLVVFVLLAQRFFHKAGELRDARIHAVSPLAVFLVGSALLVGVVLNYATWQQPFYPALIEVGYAFLGVVPIAFVFINQFRVD